jgi:hypothetical protein
MHALALVYSSTAPANRVMIMNPGTRNNMRQHVLYRSTRLQFEFRVHFLTSQARTLFKKIETLSPFKKSTRKSELLLKNRSAVSSRASSNAR